MADTIRVKQWQDEGIADELRAMAPAIQGRLRQLARFLDTGWREGRIIQRRMDEYTRGLAAAPQSYE